MALVLGVLSLRLREPSKGGMERVAMGATGADIDAEEEPAGFREAYRILKVIPTVRTMWFSLPFLFGGVLGLLIVVPLYLEEVFGLDAAERGLLTAFQGAFGIFGLFLGTALTKRYLFSDKPQRMFRLMAGHLRRRSRIGVCYIAAVPNLALMIVGGTFLVMLFSLVLPAYGTLFSIIMPAKARTVGFAITRLWALPGLVMLPFVGAVGDAHGLRWGLVVSLPGVPPRARSSSEPAAAASSPTWPPPTRRRWPPSAATRPQPGVASAGPTLRGELHMGTDTTAPRRYFDADSHVLEPVDWLTPYADPDIRDRMRTLELPVAPDQRVGRRDRGPALADRARRRPAVGTRLPRLRRVGRRRAHGHPRQVRDRRAAGVLHLRPRPVPVQRPRPALRRRAGPHAALADFCSSDPRLLPVPLIPFTDIDRALEELDAALDTGCGAVLVNTTAPSKDDGPEPPRPRPVLGSAPGRRRARS